MKANKNTENQNTKRRSTFAILFYINRTKVRKDGMCQLLCKVSIDAEWEQIGTKVSVNPAIWNPDKGRADGRSENAVTVNRAIDELTKEITEHYNHIKKSLGFVTAELVKNAVKGIGQKPVTLLALFREHNEEFKKRVGVDRIKETYDCYQRSYKHLAAFIQEKRGVEDVTLRSLDKVFYDDFEIFLQSDCRLSPKTVHEHLYRLKKMTMRAVSQGTLRRDLGHFFGILWPSYRVIDILLPSYLTVLAASSPATRTLNVLSASIPGYCPLTAPMESVCFLSFHLKVMVE